MSYVSYGSNSHPRLSRDACEAVQTGYKAASERIGEAYTVWKNAQRVLEKHDADRVALVKACEEAQPKLDAACKAAADLRLDMRHLEITRPLVFHDPQIETWLEQNPDETARHRAAAYMKAAS